MKENTKYAVSGALAGIANGFFGAGGGLILVPLLPRWIRLEEKHAFATSVVVIFPMSIVAAIIYMLRGSIDLMASLPYLIGGLAGGICSALLFKKVPAKFLKKAFSLLMIYGGIRAVLNL